MIEVRNSSIFQSRNVTIPFEIIVSIWKIQRISTFLRCFFPKIFFDSIRKIQNYCISLSGNYFFFFPRKNFRPPSVFEDLEIEKDWRRGRERERERRGASRETSRKLGERQDPWSFRLDDVRIALDDDHDDWSNIHERRGDKRGPRCRVRGCYDRDLNGPNRNRNDNSQPLYRPTLSPVASVLLIVPTADFSRSRFPDRSFKRDISFFLILHSKLFRILYWELFQYLIIFSIGILLFW